MYKNLFKIFCVLTLGASLGSLPVLAQTAERDTSVHYLTSPIYQQRYQAPMAGQPPLYPVETQPVAQNSVAFPPVQAAPLSPPTVISVSRQPIAQVPAPQLQPVSSAPVQTQAVYQPVQVAPVPAPTVFSVSQQPVAQATVQQQPVSPPPRAVNLADLPSYTYNPKLDVKNVPYKTPTAHDKNPAKSSSVALGTSTGAEIGLQVSDYRYQEHLVADQEFMHLTGAKFGLTFDATRAYSSGFFWGGDVRLAYGKSDYKGGDIDILGNVTPSTHSGESEWLFDGRLLGGYDFIFNDVFGSHKNFSLSPYTGLGFRWLYNDGRGADTNGVQGYERYSHYIYIPVGVTPRFRVTDTTRISVNTEFDWLAYGWQISSLGDTIPGATDITNSQRDGYGLRGSVMYEWPSWSIGPFFYYWNINQSATGCDNAGCGVEPHNQTIEYGLQGRYRF